MNDTMKIGEQQKLEPDITEDNLAIEHSKIIIEKPKIATEQPNDENTVTSTSMSDNERHMDIKKAEYEIKSERITSNLDKSTKNQLIDFIKRQLTLYSSNATVTDQQRRESIEELSELLCTLCSLPEIFESKSNESSDDLNSTLNQRITEINQNLVRLTDHLEIGRERQIKESSEIFKSWPLAQVSTGVNQSTNQFIDQVWKCDEGTNGQYFEQQIEIVEQSDSKDNLKEKIRDESVAKIEDLENENKTEQDVKKALVASTNEIKDEANSTGKTVDLRLAQMRFVKSFSIRFRLKKVKNFFESQNFEYSPLFEFSSACWYIAFYSKLPNLMKLRFTQNLSLYLQCGDHLKRPIIMKADFTLLNQTPGFRNKVRSFEFVYERKQGFGWPAFISFDKLVGNGFVKNDNLLFQINLWAI